MKNSGSSDWSSLGHTGKVTNVGASYFGLLNANYGRGASTTTFDKWSSNFNSAISVTLTMKGAPQVFAINPGYWYVV